LFLGKVVTVPRFIEITLHFCNLRTRHPQVSGEVTRQETNEPFSDQWSSRLRGVSDLILKFPVSRRRTVLGDFEDDVGQLPAPLPRKEIFKPLYSSHAIPFSTTKANPSFMSCQQVKASAGDRYEDIAALEL
jgi:hypothetical protein